MDIAIIVGNPKPRSKTYTFAGKVAKAIATEVSMQTGGSASHHIIDLADYGTALIQWDHNVIANLLEKIERSTYIVVASPTYKATYTGLLKIFLDLLPMHALQNKCVFPLMIGAAYTHQLAVEIHLKPVLAELGAVTTGKGLYLLDSQLADCDSLISNWILDNQTLIKAFL